MIKTGYKTAVLLASYLVITPLFFVEIAYSFSDLVSDHEYKKAIEYVHTKNIVSGYADGTFKPDQKINRAELAKILVEASFPNAASGGNCFPDVHKEWFAKYVCFARDRQILSGYPDGSFKPSQPVSFVEAAKMIALAFNLEIDENQAPWFRPYVTQLEVLQGIPLSINSFGKQISRGEIAEMVYRIYAKINSKSTQTYMQLAVTESNAAFKQSPQEAICTNTEEGKICSRALFFLPHPLAHYDPSGTDDLHLLTDSKHKQSIFFITNNFRDTNLFIDGKYEGQFDSFTAAPPSPLGGNPFVIFASGNSLIRANRWDTVTVDADVKKKLSAYIQRRIWPQEDTDNIETAIKKFEEDWLEIEKESQDFLGWTDEDVVQQVDKHLEQVYPTEIRSLMKKLEASSVSLTDLCNLLHFIYKGEVAGPSDIHFSGAFNLNEHESIVFLSFTTRAVALHLDDQTLVAVHAAYAPWANNEAVAFYGSSKTAAFRSKTGVVDTVGGAILDGNGMWVNGHIGRSFNYDLSFPRFSRQGDLLYIGVNVAGEDEQYSFTCTAAVGKEEHHFSCDDSLFAVLIANTVMFRFPRVSDDGKTVVYPELVEASEAKDDWLYPEVPFISRLVVNGIPMEAHPWIDIPYFTKNGLAVVTHTKETASLVEWDGRTAGPFISLTPQLASPSDFRGYSLFSVIHGYPGNTDLPDEVIVSPDGLSIAFGAYTPGDGWTLYKNMEPVKNFDHLNHISFSPDSTHLAYVGTSIDTTQPEPGLQMGEYRLVPVGAERAASSAVIEDDRVVGRHDKVIWMEYAKKDSSLFYIAMDENKYRLFLNGEPTGDSFDALVMNPSFTGDTTLEMGVVNGKSVNIQRYSW